MRREGVVPPVGVETAPSIRDVDREQWNRLAGPDDFYTSHEWLAAVERDSTASARYLLASAGRRLVGALPVYRVAFEGSDAYRPERLHALLRVEGDHLIAGARRCYRSSVLVAPALSADQRGEVAGALARAAAGLAREEGVEGVILPYLPTRDVESLGRSVAVTAAFESAETLVSGLGNGIDAYLARFTSHRRIAMKSEIRKFDAAGWRTGVERLADCTADAARLVSQVGRRYGDPTPESVLRRVFRRQCDAVDHRALVLTCRDAGGVLAACGIFYEWKGTLYARAMGFDYDRCHTYEYFNLLFYRPIALAQSRGLHRLHLGRDPARVKLARGAVAKPLWTARIAASDEGRRPGVDVVDSGAMRDCVANWRPARPDAFPEDEWRLPVAPRESAIGDACGSAY